MMPLNISIEANRLLPHKKVATLLRVATTKTKRLYKILKYFSTFKQGFPLPLIQRCSSF